MKKVNSKIIVILGPTASGKSDLAVKIAKKINGEVISADSRQAYKGMDIGSGKITNKEMTGIPHHLLDVASPSRKFTVSQYRKLGLKAIKTILEKEKIPIICGGTGFYIQALIDGIVIPEVAPDWKLRKKLEKKSPAELLKMLKKLDPQRTKTIEQKNPRRLIRAIEIVMKTKKPVPLLKTNPLPYPTLFIGIKKPQKELNKNIKKRLLKRLRQGMINEVKRLRNGAQSRSERAKASSTTGISWKRLEEFGLEYRWIAKFLQKKIEYKEMMERLQKDIEHYSKRQMTWFKRDSRIHWVSNIKQTNNLVKSFLKQKQA